MATLSANATKKAPQAGAAFPDFMASMIEDYWFAVADVIAATERAMSDHVRHCRHASEPVVIRAGWSCVYDGAAQ
jgi:FAD/FMN-containing dehydrogenase